MSTAQTEMLFAAIERAAQASVKPPEGHGDVYSALALAGRIRVIVSGRLWRQVEILTGPWAGRKTAPNPLGHREFMIVDAEGKRYLR